MLSNVDTFFTVPESAIPWIRLHRTHLKDSNDIIGDYCAEIGNEYMKILPHLPHHTLVKSILDIGCGLAGIDILLQRHYPDAKLILLDGDGPASDWKGGWNQDFKPFNDIKTTLEFLRLNGVEPVGITPINNIYDMPVDLCMSFLSWGFHYSLFKYRVKTPCAIATIRKDFAQTDALFHYVDYEGRRIGKDFTVIDSQPKYNLMKFSFDNVTPYK